MVGVNSRLDELQAAVLRVKLRYLEDWIAARQARAARYDQLFQEARLAGTPDAWDDSHPVMVPVVAPSCTHIFYVYAVRVRHRDRLRAYLSEHGVGTDVYYPLPLHLQPCFAPLGYREGFPRSGAGGRGIAGPAHVSRAERSSTGVCGETGCRLLSPTDLKDFAIPPRLRYSQNHDRRSSLGLIQSTTQYLSLRH